MPLKLTNRAFSKHVTASWGIDIDEDRAEAVALTVASGMLRLIHLFTANLQSTLIVFEWYLCKFIV